MNNFVALSSENSITFYEIRIIQCNTQYFKSFL